MKGAYRPSSWTWLGSWAPRLVCAAFRCVFVFFANGGVGFEAELRRSSRPYNRKEPCTKTKQQVLYRSSCRDRGRLGKRGWLDLMVLVQAPHPCRVNESLSHMVFSCLSTRDLSSNSIGTLMQLLFWHYTQVYGKRVHTRRNVGG